MFANSQRREGHLSSLNTAINALNLATEDSSIQRPATMDEFISTRDLLIMIRVRFLFCDDELPVYL